jgi:branched-subunit amino acid transport protein
MTDTAVRPRPPVADAPHVLVHAEEADPVWTVAKLAGLVAIAVLGTTLAVAIVVGGALFTLLNFS